MSRSPINGFIPLLVVLCLAGCSNQPPPIPKDFPMEQPLALKAQGVYLEKLCDNCHVLDGRGGKMGPSLHAIGARRDASWIRAYINNPQGVSRQSSMPKVEMTGAELELITQYLAAHR